MAQKKVKKSDLVRSEEPGTPSPSVPEPSVEKTSWTFRVRCVDPALRGHSVRGVCIPPGGEVTITVGKKHLNDILFDRALDAVEV